MEIKQHEEYSNNSENPAAERKEIEGALAQIMPKLEALQREEQQRQAEAMARPSLSARAISRDAGDTS